MSNTSIGSPRTTSTEFVSNRSSQPQQQAPISALLNDKRDDTSNDSKIVASFLPTPTTPVAGASSLTSMRNHFDHHSPAVASPTIPVDKERPYACTECNQTFSRPHNLKSHLTTHSSERPFKCNVCNSFFRRHHDLKRHKKLHTGERPYRCNVCNRSFARLDALNRHCRAEGGTACNNAAMKQQHQDHHQRPVVPQLHIAHPSSQPLPSIFQRHHYRHSSPPPIFPSPPALTTIANISPPDTTTDNASTTTSTIKLISSASSSSSSSSSACTLSLPPFKDPWEENAQLRHELTYWKGKAANTNTLQSQLHDLQVENKVLRSIIMDARPDNTSRHE